MDSEGSSRPSIFHSIGSKPTRRKPHDPYPLDTFNTTNGDFSTEIGKSPTLEDGESAKNLVQNNNIGNKISVKKDWNVKYNQLP